MASAGFIVNHSAQALRYLLRDIDWALEVGSDRWQTHEARALCFQKLADAKVAHRDVRNAKANIERTSATTAYYDFESAGSLYRRLVSKLKKYAYNTGEAESGTAISVQTLAANGSELAPVSCLGMIGYTRADEMRNVEGVFRDQGLSEAGARRAQSTFEVPLCKLHEDDGSDPGVEEDVSMVHLSSGGIRARQGRAAKRTRLTIDEYLDSHLPSDTDAVSFWDTVTAIQASVKVYSFNAQSQTLVERDWEAINAFMRRMVETWNDRTHQRPPATVEDLRVGSKGDIVKRMDENPTINPFGLVMRRRAPPPTGFVLDGIINDNIAVFDQSSRTSPWSRPSPFRPAPQTDVGAASSSSTRKKPRSDADVADALQASGERKIMQLLGKIVEQGLQDSSSSRSAFAGNPYAKHRRNSADRAAFTLANRDLANRMKQLYASVTSAVHNELFRRGVEIDDLAALAQSPSSPLSTTYIHLFGQQSRTAAGRHEIEQHTTVAQLAVAIAGSFLLRKILTSSDITADFGFAKYQEQDTISSTIRQSWFDAELKAHRTDFASVNRGAYIRSLGDDSVVSGISAVTKTMIRHGLAGLVEEQVGTALGSSGDYDDNVRRWVDALARPMRQAAVIACEISCASEGHGSLWAHGGEPYDRSSMTGITGSGRKVLTSLFPGLTGNQGAESEVEWLTVVKTTGSAVESIE